MGELDGVGGLRGMSGSLSSSMSINFQKSLSSSTASNMCIQCVRNVHIIVTNNVSEFLFFNEMNVKTILKLVSKQKSSKLWDYNLNQKAFPMFTDDIKSLLLSSSGQEALRRYQ